MPWVLPCLLARVGAVLHPSLQQLQPCHLFQVSAASTVVCFHVLLIVASSCASAAHPVLNVAGLLRTCHCFKIHHCGLSGELHKSRMLKIHNASLSRPSFMLNGLVGVLWQGSMLPMTREQDYSFRMKQGWPHFLNDMRIVNEAGQELPQNGTEQGSLQIRGHNIIARYHKVRDLCSWTGLQGTFAHTLS